VVLEAGRAQLQGISENREGGDIGAWLAHATGVEVLSKIGEQSTIATGLIFIVCVRTCRRGIVGEAMAFYRRMLGRRNGAGA